MTPGVLTDSLSVDSQEATSDDAVRVKVEKETALW